MCKAEYENTVCQQRQKFKKFARESARSKMQQYNCTRLGTMMRHGNWGEFVRMYVTERDRQRQSEFDSFSRYIGCNYFNKRTISQTERTCLNIK